MKDRIYVCHTYYHVYITILKELALPKEERGKATLVLSKMSNDFETLDERVRKTGLFEEVIPFDEKRESCFPELAEYRRDKGNIVFNMISRIRFTSRYAKLEEEYIPVDFKEYGNIYVFCDSDPIGYYLNKNRIFYHAVEDGYNCLEKLDAARFDNRGAFKLKAFMSKKLNLIFVQNGYGKYCLDMEVNDISVIELPCPYYKELPRRLLTDRLTDEDKDLILTVFLKDREKLDKILNDSDGGKGRVLILTEPLCTPDVRERIFKDIIDMYKGEGDIVIKKHPRDTFDYEKVFPEYSIIDGTVPMEVLNFFPVKFDRAVSVFTRLGDAKFADKKTELSFDFMDKYEDPKIHRFAEQISGKMK